MPANPKNKLLQSPYPKRAALKKRRDLEKKIKWRYAG